MSGLAVQACGDARLSNFGIFGSAERRLVFDVNNLDETLPGPWEWDVKRLAASLDVAGYGNGLASKERREIVSAAVASYRRAMRNFAAMIDLDVWYAHADLDQLRAEFDSQLQKRQRKLVDEGTAKARTHDSMQEVGKLTHLVDGRPHIVADPPPLVPVTDLLPKQTDQAAFEAQINDLLAKYRRRLETDRRYLLEQYEYADMARKVVGVGSVGTRTEPGLDGKQRDFYVRQLRDWKYSIAIEDLVPHGMRIYGEICGWTLARTHARSADRIAIAAYLGGSDVFDQAITRFAAAYADQNERDHQSLVDAVASGRITAERDM